MGKNFLFFSTATHSTCSMDFLSFFFFLVWKIRVLYNFRCREKHKFHITRKIIKSAMHCSDAAPHFAPVRWLGGGTRGSVERSRLKNHTQFADSLFALILLSHTALFFFFGGHTAAKRGKVLFFTILLSHQQKKPKNYEREERKLCGRTKAQQQSMDSCTNQSLNLHTLVECSHISTWLGFHHLTLLSFFWSFAPRETQKHKKRNEEKVFRFFLCPHTLERGEKGGEKRKFFTLLLLLLREPLFPSSYFH